MSRHLSSQMDFLLTITSNRSPRVTARSLSLVTRDPSGTSFTLHQSLIGTPREIPIDDEDNSRSLLDGRFKKGQIPGRYWLPLEKDMSKT